MKQAQIHFKKTAPLPCICFGALKSSAATCGRGICLFRLEPQLNSVLHFICSGALASFTAYYSEWGPGFKRAPLTPKVVKAVGFMSLSPHGGLHEL